MDTSFPLDDLAPNDATLERAHALAKARKWLKTGRKDHLLWGLFPTRGALAYRVMADEASPTHAYCNCSSPFACCKHVLALLLLARQSPGALGADPAPDWLDTWKERARRKPSARELDADRQARSRQKAQQRDRRLSSMQQGAEALRQWLADLLHQGLAGAPSLPPDYWEAFAARMVDAKLGGVARRIRGWPDLLQQPQGMAAWLDELAELYLLARALGRLPDLPDPLRHTALSLAGLSVRKDEVRAGKPVPDKWLVLGLEQGEDNSLFYRRVWMVGEHSRRFGLLLDFAHGAPDFDRTWQVGSAVEGTAYFYPGAREHRMLLNDHQLVQEPFRADMGYDDLPAMLHDYALALADNPWLGAWPCLLHAVIPAGKPGGWVVVDRDRRALPLAAGETAAWQLVALSGGRPLRLFGCWDGAQLQALSALADGRLLRLTEAASSLADRPGPPGR